MSSLYYRRWTRMHIGPGIRYFKIYNAMEPGLENLWHALNQVNPPPENRSYFKRTVVDREQQINNKLINNLFLKYPDLKYQSINRQKYHGDNFNSYSYSFAFINEQKKLMRAGYTMRKAFQIVEQKFQQKMKRKIDQTLVSRGLAIGNRARSLLTIYQQQVQYQSRLKMLRTKREIMKYEQQLKEIDDVLSRSENNKSEYYERIFEKVTDEPSQEINKQFEKEKRSQLTNRLTGDFKNMFSQFYQVAAYRDRLQWLTDDQIKENISTSPSKIKRLSRELVKYLNQKGQIKIGSQGELEISSTIDSKLRKFIQNSPSVRIAILNHLIGYENPNFNRQSTIENDARNQLKILRQSSQQTLSDSEKTKIRENKLKQLRLIAQKDVPQDYKIYTLLQSAEQRKLRLEIKYLQSFMKNNEDKAESAFTKLKEIIKDFRRLKFRMQKRHESLAKGELAFPEHQAFEKDVEKIEDVSAQYEDLIEYLRKKSEERRLKAIDQVDDNKINDMIKKRAIKQIVQSQGEENEPK